MKDCFAYDKGKCRALKKMKCEDCNFYNTYEDVEINRQRSMKRIMSLNKNRREVIIETYFNGQVK